MKKGILLYLVGFAVFFYLLTRINIGETVRIIIDSNKLFILLAAILVLVIPFLEALRWRFIMRQLDFDYSFRDVFSMLASSLYIGFVTPARLGEFARVSFFRGRSLGASFFSVFMDRFSDLIFIAGVGYIGMFFFVSALGQQIFWVSVAIIGSFLFAAIAVLRRDFVRLFLSFVFHRIIPEKFKPELKTIFYDFYRSFFRLLNFRSVLVILALTILSWLLYYAAVYLLALAIGINISFIHMATVVSVASFLSILPISISGIGTRDAAFVFFFGLLSLKSEFAIALSTLVLILMVLVAVCCFPFYLMKPVNFLFFQEKDR